MHTKKDDYGCIVVGFVGHRGVCGFVTRLERFCVSDVNDHVVDPVYAVSNGGGVDDFTFFIAQWRQLIARCGFAHFGAALCGVCGLGDAGQFARRVRVAVG